MYLRQEGRGIGLLNKIKAYSLQDKGADTVEANQSLGFNVDYRNYNIAADILCFFKIKSVRLLTNNPHKVDALEACGVKVEERIGLQVGRNINNLGYLKTKAFKMGHFIGV